MKVLNNLSHYVAILVTGTMRKIDESKAGAKNKIVPVKWTRFLQRGHCDKHAARGSFDVEVGVVGRATDSRVWMYCVALIAQKPKPLSAN